MLYNLLCFIFVMLGCASAQSGGVRSSMTCAQRPQYLPQVDFTHRFLLTVNVEVSALKKPNSLNEIISWRNHNQAGKPNTQVQITLDARPTTAISPNWIIFMRSEDGTFFRYDHGSRWNRNSPSSVKVGTGRIYEIQMEWNGETVSIYIDGVLMKSWTGASGFGKDFTWRRTSCRGFTGNIDFHADTCGYKQFRGTMVGASDAFTVSEPGFLSHECHLGNQYSGIQNVESCSSLCNQNSECVYFQYGGHEDCWLFGFPSTCTSHVTHEDYDLYYFQCQEPDVNCEGSWSPFGDCSETCGSGTQTRTFTVTTPKLGFGSSCDVADGALETRMCNTQVCDVNCEGSWSPFGDCSETCGSGTQTRTYTVTTPKLGFGSSCDVADGALETQMCNTHVCGAPVDPIDAPDTTTCSYEEFRGTMVGASNTFTVSEPGFLIAHCHLGDKTYQVDAESCANVCIENEECEYFQYGEDSEECWSFASPMQCTSHVPYDGYDVYYFPSGCGAPGNGGGRRRRLLALNMN